MKDIITSYMADIREAGAGIDAAPMKLSNAVQRTVRALCAVKRKRKKVIFIGNGGSASIASHQAIDYWKNGGIRAFSLNDASALTCISNDFGYASVFQKPLEMFTDRGDMLFAISSSGRSSNIINAVRAARKKGAFCVTLSGFSAKNPLRRLGDINFYVPSSSYGIVEITHLAICHAIVDRIMGMRGSK